MTRNLHPIVAALLTASACGEHSFVNLVGVTAVRGTDDRITLTTAHQCEAVGPGTCDATTVPQYCVTATWVVTDQLADGGRYVPSDGGLVLDAGIAGAHACKSLNGGTITPLVMVSELPVPRLPPTAIVFVVTGGRNDLGFQDGGSDADGRILSP
jgi:hypothetical protein